MYEKIYNNSIRSVGSFTSRYLMMNLFSIVQINLIICQCIYIVHKKLKIEVFPDFLALIVFFYMLFANP